MDEETLANSSDPNQADPNAVNEALTDEQKQQLQDELAAAQAAVAEAELQAQQAEDTLERFDVPASEGHVKHVSFGR